MKKQNIIFLLIILIGVGFLIAAISLFFTMPHVNLYPELYSDWMDHIYPIAMTFLIVGLFIVLFLVCFISQRGKDPTKFSCWDCQP